MGADAGRTGPSVLDVARLSGVSPSTVCRVINKRLNVSESARVRVLEACATLGFRKNSAASMLRLRKSDVVACLMPDSTNEMFIDKVDSLKRAVLAMGRRWRYHVYHGQEEAMRMLDEIVAGRPAGAILGCALDDEARRLLSLNDVAVVCYDQDDPVCDSVALDRSIGVSEAVSHILERGRRNMLVLGFTLDSERGQGCLKAYELAGLPANLISVQCGDTWMRDLFKYGYQNIDIALERYKFDAVMAVNDASAIGAMRRLIERGFRVPDDISILGFDDIMVSSFTNPALSTVSQPKELLAEASVDFLARRLADPSLPRQFKRLSTRFVKRESA